MTGYFSTLFDPPQQSGFFGLDADSADATSGGMVIPVVANFGPRGGAGKQADKPYWAGILGYPSADPRMPFFVLPPNAIFNMPIIRRPEQLPGAPYVGDEDGRPHLDGWNPWEGRPVSPGRGI